MIIGVLKEIQDHEYRVALTPDGARTLYKRGHTVIVQKGCGEGSGFSDKDYHKAGARLAPNALTVCRSAEMVLKVKQPEPRDLTLFRPGQILFSYLHAQTRRWLLEGLMERRVSAIAYEDVVLPDGSRPLLAPMSQIAGHMAVIIGCQFLQRHHGGMGVMLGTMSGVRDPLVVILGGGVAGMRAARAAIGLGAQVYIMEISPDRRKRIERELTEYRCKVIAPNKRLLNRILPDTVLLINTTNWPAHTQDHLVTRAMVCRMPRGSVIVDVTADLCGAIETTQRHTSHSSPTFVEEGVLHYVVPNIPGAVPRTATFALTASTFPYVQEIADKGLIAAIQENPVLLKALNCHNGMCTSQALAKIHKFKWCEARKALAEKSV